MKNAIFTVLNDGYLPLFKTFVNSIKTNYPQHPTIFVACKECNQYTCNYIRSLTNVVPISFREKCIGNSLVLQRYRLWDPEDITQADNILYLDNDILVLESLDELFESSEFFIVSNYDPHNSIRIFRNDINRLNVDNLLDRFFLRYPDGRHDMGNAGVFMIPKKYRTRMYFEKLLDIHAEFIHYAAYEDQSIISLWCHYFNIKIMSNRESLKYNVQPSNYSVPDFDIPLQEAKILHFSSPKKPGTEEFENWNWIPEFQKQSMMELYQYYTVDRIK